MEVARRDLGPSHPVTNAFQNPILKSRPSTAPNASTSTTTGARRQRLGRSVLGQRADGSTYTVGWPAFTLIDLQESRRHGLHQGQAGAMMLGGGNGSPFYEEGIFGLL